MNRSATFTTSEAILEFFARSDIRNKHNGLDLLRRYTPDMEVQVNVAVDGGEPVAGKQNTWMNPDDSLSEEWHHVRIPRNAKTEPERNDWPVRFDLARHVEGIGMTGWDFGGRCSRWFGFDFDAIAGHAVGVGVSEKDLEAVKSAAWKIPWLEIRKSTGGSGLHVYALCSADGIATANHTEHAALGRAILEMMSTATGFNFVSKVDACGANMWIWHRKSSLANEGLKLLKSAEARLNAADIPGDWRSHLAVVERKRATQRVIGVPTDADDSFDDLISSRRHVPLNTEHRRIMDAMSGNGFSAIYQQDNHLIQAHTARLAQLIADPKMQIRGIFKTLSGGTDPGTPNAFMFPLANGGWRVFRFSPGTKEADTWDQGDGWTSCEFNVRSTLVVAADAEGGFERSDNAYAFPTTTQGLAALKGMGGETITPEWCAERQFIVKPHRSPRKLTLVIEFKEDDDNPTTKTEMRNHGWNIEGNRVDTKRWTKVIRLPASDNADIADELLERCDNHIRSVKTTDGQDAGWRIVDADRIWVERDRTAAKDALAGLGVPVSEISTSIAKLQNRNWTLGNFPFQPEFPGGRVWNIGAQLAFKPTDEDRPMVHPHWDSVLAHLGQGLDEAAEADQWCIKNGVTTGATYLLHWCASLFRQPAQKLPYLFFFGGQETGKSSLHYSLGLLMSRGHVEARNSLLTQFNGELDGAILAYVEEVDLTIKGSEAYNRLKDLVTAHKVSINAKYANVYTSPSYLHWIQVANERRFCPAFDDDTRIVFAHVANKPVVDIPWRILAAILEREAPDFLRTLMDLRLPEGVGRLWLPVLDTEAKRHAVSEAKESGQATKGFDANGLDTALRLLLLKEGSNFYQGLVSDLLARLGAGPWSQDPNVFGRELKAVFKNAHERGFKATPKRSGDGTEWTFAEHWNESNIDGLQEWAQLAHLAEYASLVTAGQSKSIFVPTGGSSSSPESPVAV